MRPQFSATTRYLAFIAAPVMPISYPGPQGHLYVFDMATGKKSRVGPQGPLLSSFAWSPRSDRLAWQVTLLHGGYPQRRPNPKGPLVVGLASAGSPRNVVLVHPPGKNGDIVDPENLSSLRRMEAFSGARTEQVSFTGETKADPAP